MARTQTVTAETIKPLVEVDLKTPAQLPKNWSFDYNCRHPSRGSKAYKDMMKTLKDEPQQFVMNNTGIYLANGKYILDGGHTYLALQDALKEGFDLSNVFVKVTDYGKMSEQEMAVRSKWLNNKVTPPMRGEKDLLGEWDILKENLDAKYKDLYEFRPNTNPNHVEDVGFLVGLMHAWGSTSPEKAYSNKGQLVRLFKADKYKPYIHLLTQAIEIYSQIAKDMSSFKPPKHPTTKKAMMESVDKWTGVKVKNTRLPNGEEGEMYIPASYILPVFAAIGGLIDESTHEWKKDPMKEWAAKKSKMMLRLYTDYKLNGRNPTKLGKSREVYKNQVIALFAP